MAKKVQKSFGGRSDSKGRRYQNAIATWHLMELLISYDDLSAVTSVSQETEDAIDDIKVEREGLPTKYYQAKCIESGGAEWSLSALGHSGILDSIANALHGKVTDSLNVLASPLRRGSIHKLANHARRSGLEIFLDELEGQKSFDLFQSLADITGGQTKAFDFLRSYQEEQWPAGPDDIRLKCFGKHKDSPFVHVDGLWDALTEIASETSVSGVRLGYADLRERLEAKLPSIRSYEVNSIDINMIRRVAEPEWYIHRDEERYFLSAFRDFLHGISDNLIYIGHGGTGKSSMYEWMRRECEFHQRVQPSLRLVALVAEGESPRDFLSSINRSLAKVTHTQFDGEGSSQVDTFVNLLKLAESRGEKILILIDQLESLFESLDYVTSRDKLAAAKHSLFKAMYLSSRSKSVMWVLTARTEHYMLLFPSEKERRKYKFTYCTLDEFSPNHQSRLLARLLELSKLSMVPEARELLVSQCPPKPQSLVLSFLALRDSIRDREDTEISENDLVEIRPWENDFKADCDALDENEEKVVYALAYLGLSLSRTTFAINEILEVIDEKVGLTRDKIADVLRALQQERYLVRQPNKSWYSLYHRNFADYVYERYSAQHVSISPSLDLHKSDIRANRLSAIGTLAAGMAHEIKNPLVSLKTFIQLLPDRVDDPEFMETFTDVVPHELDRIDNIVSRLLDYARPRPVNRVRIDVKALIEDVLALIENVTRKDFIEVETVFESDLPYIGGDEQQLFQVFLNVFLNAVDAMSDSKVAKLRITITAFDSAASEQTGSRCLKVEIEDNGRGIERDNVEDVFLPFYSSSESGTGLGLAVVHAIVLQRAVAPAKLTVAIEAPPLEEQLSSMTKEEVQFLRDRCQLKDKPNETLTWWHYCSDPGETRVTSNLAYAWQAEFRAYHIWTHPALKNYKYMMWLDSDVNIAKHWDMDPMKTMIENDLTVLYAGWPYGKLRDKAVKKKMTGAYNTSICSIQKTSGSEHIYPKLCKDQKGYFEIRQIAGNHHITNLDVFRKEVHQKFLKNFTGDFRFNRKFDDQLAVTLVGMFEHYLVNGFDNPSVKYTMWNERANGLTLKIGHHRIYDVQENDKNERAIVSRPKFFNHIKANYTGLEERCGNIFFPGRKEKELI